LVVKGKETFIGTLRKAKCDQFSVRARAAAQPPSRQLRVSSQRPVPRSSIWR
jgi:hypothetical protein